MHVKSGTYHDKMTTEDTEVTETSFSVFSVKSQKRGEPEAGSSLLLSRSPRFAFAFSPRSKAPSSLWLIKG